MLKTVFIVNELLSINKDIHELADIIEVQEQKHQEFVKKLEERAKGQQPTIVRPAIAGSLEPPGGLAAWDFLDKKWRNLYDSATAEIRRQIQRTAL